MKQCHFCTKENEINNKFCIYCGTKFIETKKKESQKEILDSNTPLYQNIRYSYDGLFIALLAKVAKADGQISEVEAKALGDVFDNLSTFRQDIPNIRAVYKLILATEKEDISNVADICNHLLSLNIDKATKITFIESLLLLSYSHGAFNQHNENLIIKIVSFLHIDFSIYQEMKSKFEPQEKEREQTSFTGARLSIEECYEVLEVVPNDSSQIIKQQYRKMVRNYHTDMLSSKELPKDMIIFAEEKLKKINRAYEILKQHKGIK